MLAIAIIIYIIAALVGLGPLWPIHMISGKAGPIGIVLALCWFALLIAGIKS